MLSKEDLESIGYSFHESDFQRPFYEDPDGEGSEDYGTRDEAVSAAAVDAKSKYALHRCDNCEKLHTEAMLEDIRKYSERVSPGGVVPSGQCVDCGALCYPFEDDTPDWETVMDYFGLDKSFQWSAQQVEDYTLQYLASLASEKQSSADSAKAIAFVERVARLMKWGESDDNGEPFTPSDGADDSHACLMDLIDEARQLTRHLCDKRQSCESLVGSIR